MYADDLLLISSTCSDLRRMLQTVFSKPTVYNTVTFNTAVSIIPVYRASLVPPTDCFTWTYIKYSGIKSLIIWRMCRHICISHAWHTDVNVGLLIFFRFLLSAFATRQRLRRRIVFPV